MEMGNQQLKLLGYSKRIRLEHYPTTRLVMKYLNGERYLLNTTPMYKMRDEYKY